MNSLSEGVVSPVTLEVDGAMNALSGEIEQLATVVKEVEERLKGVVLPTPMLQESQSANSIPARFGCVLATCIDSQADYIRANRERLQVLLAALQL